MAPFLFRRIFLSGSIFAILFLWFTLHTLSLCPLGQDTGVGKNKDEDDKDYEQYQPDNREIVLEGIYELLLMNEEMKHLILTTANANDIRKMGIQYGMITLRRDGADKVLQGITTIEEVFRVSQA